ncbi:MAG: DUF2088 domain-containing protein [Syntrophobacterales bacterium]|nr:MAG: DUF2088 domain-containing protein [Syntrophobacterales bacterium]
MSIIEGILADIRLPAFARANQLFDTACLDEEAIRRKIIGISENESIFGTIKPGARVSITAGSRGITHMDVILRELVAQLKKRGARPYIVACMGSHGGNASGQKKILQNLGITEEQTGAQIISSDELIVVGHTSDGRSVYADKFAAESDAVIVVNRVKPHTAFRAPVESGLQKMLAIGLGKQKGADACHIRGFEGMYENVRDFSHVIVSHLPVAFGLGIIENAYGEVFDCVALAGPDIPVEEPKLLEMARALMPKLLFDDIDVLVVGEMGKDISGSGMDTNIIGRYPTSGMIGWPRIGKIVTLDLTDASEGHAHGMGFANFISRKLFDKIDMDKTYTNCLTNKVDAPAKIPPVMPNDLCAIKAAIKTCRTTDPEEIRAVLIKNTHDLERIYISKALAAEAASNAGVVLTGSAHDIGFSRNGDVPMSLWER